MNPQPVLTPDIDAEGYVYVDGQHVIDPERQKPFKPINGQLRYKLTIAYDGTAFFGWQKQKHPEGGELRTVQRTVQDAVKSLLPDERINLVGASRTDRGVHALGQAATFDAKCPIPVARLAKAISSRLPEDVEIRAARIVPFGFNVIGGAKTKQYRYRIYTASMRPLGDRHQVFHCTFPLDLDRMNDAAQRMVGTHDVSGLAYVKHGRDNTIRTIHKCWAQRVSDDRVDIYTEGSGFLYNQVRIMAGTLIEVGRGAMPAEQVDRVLKEVDRSLAGPTLEPQGLTLMWIEHEGV